MSNNTTRSSCTSAQSAEYVDEKSVFDQRITNEEHVLVDFYAEWCGPCQLMSPIVDELAAESDAVILKVDVDALPQIASRFDVNTVPTFVAFNDGAVHDRLVGMQEKAALAQIFP